MTNCAVHCTECEYPLYLDHNEDCVHECESGYYHSDNPTKTCKVCVDPCETCTNEHFCTRCLRGFLMSEEGTCVDPCPMGYVSETDSKTCVPCDSTCRTCHGTGLDHCDSCEPPLYLHNHNCVTICPVGMYDHD